MRSRGFCRLDRARGRSLLRAQLGRLQMLLRRFRQLLRTTPAGVVTQWHGWFPRSPLGIRGRNAGLTALQIVARWWRRHP
ncbi:MAG: hypothetical protein JXB35_17855 [Anaerolineae bacterium]|nr:hypothetical protein [Anaerolineae bacterium]